MKRSRGMVPEFSYLLRYVSPHKATCKIKKAKNEISKLHVAVINLRRALHGISIEPSCLL